LPVDRGPMSSDVRVAPMALRGPPDGIQEEKQQEMMMAAQQQVSNG